MRFWPGNGVPIVAAAVVSVLVLPSAASAEVLTVDGKANIFGAGHAATPSPSDGQLPPFTSFSAGAGRALTISGATGTVNWGSGSNAADGGSGGQNISSLAGVSGVTDGDARFYLVGVFLTDAEPADPAPAILNFGSAGLGHDFASLSPEIGQTFFIGDGQTSGAATQQFNVPQTATRLFLGFTDAGGFNGTPGFYNDNSGSLDVTFDISSPPSGGTGGGTGGGSTGGTGESGGEAADPTLFTEFFNLGRFDGSPLFKLADKRGAPTTRLLDGSLGLPVNTTGSCRLELVELRSQPLVGFASRAARRKLGLLKKVTVVARGPGRWVLPLKLTRKAKRLLRRHTVKRRARASLVLRDRAIVRCTPVEFPTQPVGPVQLPTPTLPPVPTGGPPTTVRVELPVQLPQAPVNRERHFSGSGTGTPQGSSTIRFVANRDRVDILGGQLKYYCRGPGSKPMRMIDFDLSQLPNITVRGTFFHLDHTTPWSNLVADLPHQYRITVTGSLDAGQANIRVVLHALEGTTLCGGDTTWRVTPED